MGAENRERNVWMRAFHELKKLDAAMPGSFVAYGASEMVPGNQDYYGLPRQVRPAVVDAASWASRAYRAAQSSLKGLREAEMKQRLSSKRRFGTFFVVFQAFQPQCDDFKL